MTSRTPGLVAVLLSLVFLGFGCTPLPIGSPDLPTTPPEDARVDTDVEAQEAPTGTGNSETSAPDEPSATEGEKAPRSAKPYYIAYSQAEFDRARAEGRPIVLYFWASWCPICRAEEPKIIADIENADVPVAGFRVNFDVEADLKSFYKIPYQHTTVILDAEGNETERFLGPVSTEERYRAFSEAYGN